jgi:hypothetical protein
METTIHKVIGTVFGLDKETGQITEVLTAPFTSLDACWAAAVEFNVAIAEKGGGALMVCWPLIEKALMI